MVYHPLSSVTTNKDKAVRSPNENDVLCGRGFGPYSHIGNQRFREIVGQHKTMYNAVDNSNDLKTFIAEEVVHFVHTQNPSGRFLSKSCGIWYEVPRSVAVQKTKQALREKEKWSKCDSYLETKPCFNVSKRSIKSRRSRRRRRCQNDDDSVTKSYKSRQVLYSDESKEYITEKMHSHQEDEVLNESYGRMIFTDIDPNLYMSESEVDEIDLLIFGAFRDEVC